MAEPMSALAAIGSISSILQILDFTAKVVSKSRELMNASGNALPENEDVERLAEEYERLSIEIQSTPHSFRPLTAQEAAVDNLAESCREEGRKLLDLLNNLKVKPGLQGARRYYETARQTTRAVRKREKIESRQKHLHELNGQLSVAVLDTLRSDQRASVGVLLDRIDQREASTVSTVLGAKSEILQAIRTLSEAEKISRIIDSLRFPEMKLRRDAIETAYEDTYEWIFKDTSLQFQDWLSSGQDIFWISGKAGSGKSTLMKFLGQHSTTEHCLAVWAGGESVSVSEFYFWYLGQPMQKSIPGLLQSILYQLFRQSQGLVKTVLSRRWQQDDCFHRDSDPWTLEELSQAVHDVADAQLLRRRFCFFIDGLDEYSGDQLSLVRLLQRLTKHPNIKICASSRPWNVFNWAFEGGEHLLRLEDLTRADIRRYVQGELSDLEHESDLRHLIEEVIEKAQGVFLWVYLVVRSLREGLIEGDDFSTMRLRLQHFPADLGAYFGLMLSRIDPIYRETTGQSLKLAMLLQEPRIQAAFGGKPHFHYFWMIKQGIRLPNFDLSQPIKHQVLTELQRMALVTRKFITATCKDLLHIPAFNALESTASFYACDLQVEFLHRTVYEYLCTEAMQGLFNPHIPAGMEVYDYLGRLVLARLKMMALPLDRDRLRLVKIDVEKLKRMTEEDSKTFQELDRVLEHYQLYHQFQRTQGLNADPSTPSDADTLGEITI